ncbi:DUF1415 domain-containing protein [Alteromonas sp. 5E99-2]|uniref:DUF1415 family protein n=1 Tax=Alteromonas sp. 5E99-2 TaxID=2817683 RepID=UPI001A98027A|nr:DUF1415 family protein [Alteromonas sp. 5E99-2]MBO1255342.1 DUF1415 domain-containing protein [Alteromonas sp. 5E99-2]
MSDQRISIIHEWVDEWIIKENFCPFAQPARHQEKIDIVINDDTSWSRIYEALRKECQSLLTSKTKTTTLFALGRACTDFFDYLSLLDGAQALLEQEGWLGTFQLASFHPDYVFEGENEDSPTHYTNRSPLPVLHILKEDEVARVIKSQSQADDIVIRNQHRLEEIGISKAEEQLKHWQTAIQNAKQIEC